MGIYVRKERGKPSLSIGYSVTEELRVRFGLKIRQVRESTGGNNRRTAETLLAQRKRQVKEGTWMPRTDGGSADSILVKTYFETKLAHRDLAGIKSTHDARQRLRDHVFPVIGEKRLRDVTRKDIVNLINHYQRTPNAKQELPAPRTVHRVYEDLRVIWAEAVEVDEIVPATPCTLKIRRGELPEKLDKDPRWRAGAVYTKEEVELLISSPEGFWPQRIMCALMFLTGARVSEAAGLLWRDYDPKMKPLGRLVIATQGDGGRTKMGTTREVPVHPVLAALLAQWRLEGFPQFFGSAPRADDFIVPRVTERGLKAHRDKPQYVSRVHGRLQADLMRLGFRARRVHDARRTLITLARSDGANADLLKWVTHGPPKSKIMEVYTSPAWETLCAQISCLKIELRKPEGASVTRIGGASS